MRDSEYECVALKRGWVPEWLWRMFAPVVKYEPFRSLLTYSIGGGKRYI